MNTLYRLLVIALLAANLYVAFSANVNAYNASWLLMQIMSQTAEPGQDS